MARRMFSTEIVSSDAFLNMPVSARELYFQLGMYADDDGFVNPLRIIRMVGASQDDLQIILAKRFVLPFESGVVVIKHWKINNYLRPDRYHETKYLEEKNALEIKENRAYTEKNKPMDTIGIPKINQMDTIGTPSIDKNRLDKNNILDTNVSNKTQASGKSKTFGNPSLNQGLELLEELYPKFTNRQLNRYALNRLIKAKGSERVFKAIRYAKEIKKKEYAPQISNYLMLEKKWDQLEDFARRQQPTKNSGFSEGFKIIKA